MAKTRPASRSATRKPPDPAAEELRRLRKDPWCAAALRTGTDLDVVRQAFERRNPPHPLDRLRAVGVELQTLEIRRHELVAERHQLVDVLRAAGETWATLTEAAQVSRPTLIQSGRP